MKKLVLAVAMIILGSTAAHADFIGNKSSKLFFPDSCSYVKLIKKDNIVNFRSSKEAMDAGYTLSSKCKSDAPDAIVFIGNKSSKLFFPVSCSYVKMIKDENKVSFRSSDEAKAAGYKVSSKCSQ